METVMANLPNLLVGVILAIVTAYVTVRLSIGRFRVEQWWSRKADAYASIIEGLYHMKSLHSAYVSEYTRGAQMSEERKASLAKKAAEGYEQVRKAIDARGFLLCQRAGKALETLDAALDQADEAEDFWEHCELGIDAVKKCLAELPLIAKKDLGVR